MDALQVKFVRGPTQQITNKNYNYEEQLNMLSKNMIEILSDKPNPDQTFEDMKKPSGLKVSLLNHQCYSMQWLKWREKNYPYGAILADDMGLGKTLTILSYLRLIKDERERAAKEKRKKLNGDNEDDDENGDDENNDRNNYDDEEIFNGSSKDYLKRIKSKKKQMEDNSSRRLRTLIILPASLLHQWQGEINTKFEKNAFKFHVYHDANRKK